MSDLVRIGNTILSATSVKWSLIGEPFEGILALDWEQQRKRKKVHGSRRNGRPLGRTAGKYEVTSFTLTMLVDSYDILTTSLTLLGLGSYGDAEFPFIGQYVEPVPSLVGASPVVTLIGEDCVIDGEKESYAEGIDEKVVEVSIDCMAFTRNGKRLYSLQRSF